jgi:hypothetical protein
MVAILLMGKTYSMPIDGMEDTTETVSFTIESNTTETTTLSPEVDHEWEDLVLAGPAVVNYLSLFMVFASRQDEGLIPPAWYSIRVMS